MISSQTVQTSLLCAVLIGLALFVIRHNRRAAVNKLFCLSVLIIVGWIISISISLSMKGINQTVIFGRIAFAFASAIPFTLLWMFHAFTDSSPKRTLTVTGLISSFFIILSFSPWIVSGSFLVPHRTNFIYGPLHPFFGAYFIICFGFALYTLWTKIRLASGVKKLQLRYLLLGILIGGAGATTTNLLIPLIWKTSRYSFLGPYFSLAVFSFSAHAIIRYRLMDIKVVIRKGVVYVCTIFIVTLVFMGLTVVLGLATGYRSGRISLNTAVALAVIVAIFFEPLKHWIQDSLNRYLYRQTYDYDRTIREASRRMSTILELQPLLSYLTEVIADTLKTEMVTVYLMDPLRQAFTLRVFRLTGEQEPEPSSRVISRPSPLITFLEHKKKILIRDEVPEDSSDQLSTSAVRELQSLGGEIAIPFSQDDTVSGFLLIGPKLSGDPYFSEDVDLLSTLAGQATIAIENAQLYHQVVLVNEYIENILATMENGVIAVAVDGTVTLFNSAAERLTQLNSGHIRGGSLQNLPVSIAAPLEATLADRKPRTHVETIIQDAAGHLTPVICSTSTLKDRAGTILGAVAVFSDLTKLKELESEKRRAERLAAIGGLASGIAHEIKNPLVAIRTFAELLPERFSDKDFHGQFSKVVIKEIQRIDELVARLRGLAIHPTQQLVPLDLRHPIEETLALLRGQLEQKRVMVTSTYQGELPFILGDSAQLKQLFLNLFINALEAMEPGDELSIRSASREVLGNQTLILEIMDTGTGIPEDMIGKIFDPFITTKPGGSGLGLSICRGIADVHRAAIRAQNNPHGKGTTITIEFPVVQRVPAETYTQ